MATTVKTKAESKPEIATTVAASLVKLAVVFATATGQTVTALVNFALGTRKESPDREAGETLVKAAIIHAAGMEKATENMQLAYLRLPDIAPVVSRVLRLAYPKTPEASKELDLALAFNAKQTNPFKTVGQGALLDIARGNVTFQAVIDGKATAKKRKARTPEAGKLNPDARKGLTEGIALLLKGYVGKVGSDRVTIDQANAIWQDATTKRAAELAK